MCELTPEGICESVAELLENEEKRIRLSRAAGEKKLAYGEDLKLLLALLK